MAQGRDLSLSTATLKIKFQLHSLPFIALIASFIPMSGTVLSSEERQVHDPPQIPFKIVMNKISSYGPKIPKTNPAPLFMTISLPFIATNLILMQKSIFRNGTREEQMENGKYSSNSVPFHSTEILGMECVVEELTFSNKLLLTFI